MNDLVKKQKIAIKEFYKSIKILEDLKVIRSKVVFGDIGEFLCTITFQNLKLVQEKTNEGYDAIDNEQKVQIKFSDSSYTKNIDLGDPEKYDYLIVVLTRESAHIYKSDEEKNCDYYFYKFSKSDVQKLKINSGTYTLSKTKHKQNAIKTLNIEDI